MGKKPKRRSTKAVASSRFTELDIFRAAFVRRFGGVAVFSGDHHWDRDKFGAAVVDQTFSATIAESAASYQGLGDVADNWFSYVGLRAYSEATIGDPLIRLRRDGSSATEQDFGSVAGGGLDLAGIASFLAVGGASNLFVTKLYEQLTGNDYAQTDQTRQPLFLLNTHNGLPVIRFVAASSHRLIRTSTVQAQPITAAMVVEHPDGSAIQRFMTFSSGGIFIAFANTGDDNISVAAGGTLTDVACTDDQMNSVLINFNDASSNVTVNGSTTATSALGTAGFTASPETQNMGCNFNQSNFCNADFMEAGFRSVASDSTALAAIYANQDAFFSVGA